MQISGTPACDLGLGDKWSLNIAATGRRNVSNQIQLSFLVFLHTEERMRLPPPPKGEVVTIDNDTRGGMLTHVIEIGTPLQAQVGFPSHFTASVPKAFLWTELHDGITRRS
jgi:hypothetical protein